VDGAADRVREGSAADVDIWNQGAREIAGKMGMEVGKIGGGIAEGSVGNAEGDWRQQNEKGVHRGQRRLDQKKPSVSMKTLNSESRQYQNLLKFCTTGKSVWHWERAGESITAKARHLNYRQERKTSA
jgi:hypothetical protein